MSASTLPAGLLFRTIRLGLCGVALAGCVHTAPAPAPAPTGPGVDAATVARSVVLCATTEADLRSALGQPTGASATPAS